MKIKTFKIGGIYPNDNKITSEVPIVRLPDPKQAEVMLLQHIGSPSQCIVKVGEHVEFEQLLAEDSSFVSACVHAPISGVIKSIERKRNSQGYYVESITIVSESEDDAINYSNVNPRTRTQAEVDSLTAKEIIDIVDNSGIVGMGGATFPTRVKLLPPEGMQPSLVIINGAECEPYLTCDDALMRAYPAEIVKGIELIMRATGVKQAKIGIEKNKPVAIKIINEILQGRKDIEVIPLKKKYPQGGEKQIIEAILSKEVPTGALPIATGAIVQNVATAFAVYDAIYNYHPITKRVVTVTGPNVKNPGNFIATIGTPIRDLIEAVGGLPEDTGKVIAGGPMMGKAVVNLDAPVTKGLSGVLIFPKEESLRKEEGPCIRCSKCVNVCPMGLEPYLIMTYSKYENWEECEKNKAANCIECGSCSYICPSNRPLLDFIRFGKQKVNNIIKQRNKR